MVEFSENLSKRYEGGSATVQRAYYRLAVRVGEIPYFGRGLDLQDFPIGEDISGAVLSVLSDLNADIDVSGDRVCVAGVMLDVPRGSF